MGPPSDAAAGIAAKSLRALVRGTLLLTLISETGCHLQAHGDSSRPRTTTVYRARGAEQKLLLALYETSPTACRVCSLPTFVHWASESFLHAQVAQPRSASARRQTHPIDSNHCASHPIDCRAADPPALASLPLTAAPSSAPRHPLFVRLRNNDSEQDFATERVRWRRTRWWPLALPKAHRRLALVPLTRFVTALARRFSCASTHRISTALRLTLFVDSKRGANRLHG